MSDITYHKESGDSFRALNDAAFELVAISNALMVAGNQQLSKDIRNIAHKVDLHSSLMNGAMGKAIHDRITIIGKVAGKQMESVLAGIAVERKAHGGQGCAGKTVNAEQAVRVALAVRCGDISTLGDDTQALAKQLLRGERIKTKNRSIVDGFGMITQDLRIMGDDFEDMKNRIFEEE